MVSWVTLLNVRELKEYREPNLWNSGEGRWGQKNIQPPPQKKKLFSSYYLYLNVFVVVNHGVDIVKSLSGEWNNQISLISCRHQTGSCVDHVTAHMVFFVSCRDHF